MAGVACRDEDGVDAVVDADKLIAKSVGCPTRDVFLIVLGDVCFTGLGKSLHLELQGCCFLIFLARDENNYWGEKK